MAEAAKALGSGAEVAASVITFPGTVGSQFIPLRYVAAIVAGNAFEFYDFTTYGFFAVYIGRAFFPSHSAASSLLLSLATFGAGFLTRPIGAMVIGPMGDRIGRKPVMLLTFVLMGISVAGFALVPSYAHIGYAAPVMVVLFRLLQGFALGGEVGPTTAYLIEAAPSHRRGLYGSLQAAGQNLAVLTSGVVGTLLANALNGGQLQNWGSRLAVLVGACVIPLGLIIRSNLPETLHAADDAPLAPDATKGDLKAEERVRPYMGLIVLGLMMLTSATVGTYIRNYMTTYALTILQLPAAVAFGVTAVTGILATFAALCGGQLSDRFGRKPVLLISTTLVLLSNFPAFWLILHLRTALVFYAATGWLAAFLASGTGVILVTITESLPKNIRSGVVATMYAFAISIFGGSTQFILGWLLDVTKNPFMPAYYGSIAAALGLLAIALISESSPTKLLDLPTAEGGIDA